MNPLQPSPCCGFDHATYGDCGRVVPDVDQYRAAGMKRSPGRCGALAIGLSDIPHPCLLGRGLTQCGHDAFYVFRTPDHTKGFFRCIEHAKQDIKTFLDAGLVGAVVRCECTCHTPHWNDVTNCWGPCCSCDGAPCQGGPAQLLPEAQWADVFTKIQEPNNEPLPPDQT